MRIEHAMQWLDSVIIGVVEGVTEFLPISSTGHMILTKHLLGLSGEVVDAFIVFIQLGAILAVVWLYAERFKRLFQFTEPSGFAGVRGLTLLGITTFPILAVGFVLKDLIKAYLFGPVTVVWALGVGGVAIILLEKFYKPAHHTESLDDLTVKQAVTIGLCQCLALWPGMSRAASTIFGGLFAGLTRQQAAEYSFLAAVPVMVVACTKDLLDVAHLLTAQDVQSFAIGFVVAFISAVVAVKGFISLLQRFTLVPFGVYRIVVAVLFYGVMAGHVLK